MKSTLLLAILLACGTACGTKPTVEQIGPVMVRSTRWAPHQASAMVVEFPNGEIKTFDYICEPAVGAWAGMKAEITYDWDSDGTCYHIIRIRRVE